MTSKKAPKHIHVFAEKNINIDKHYILTKELPNTYSKRKNKKNDRIIAAK